MTEDRVTVTVELRGLYPHDTHENNERWIRAVLRRGLNTTHMATQATVEGPLLGFRDD